MQITEPPLLATLTPHDVVPDLGGETLRIPPAGIVPRLLLSEGRQEHLRVADPARPDDETAVRDVPLAVGAAWLGIDPPLPDPRPGTVYVTSRVVAEHFPERADLVWPDDLIRDADGQVVAARRLAKRGDDPTGGDGADAQASGGRAAPTPAPTPATAPAAPAPAAPAPAAGAER